jgi:tRNA A37 threonylcarbamoyladenosine dehydratase
MLKAFAAEHSVIVAPQSEQDLQRIQQLQGLNQSPHLAANTALAATFGLMPSTTVITGLCPKCTHQNAVEAKFCAECGTGLR